MSDPDSELREYRDGYEAGLVECNRQSDTGIAQGIAEGVLVVATLGLTEIGRLGHSDAYNAGFSDGERGREFDPQSYFKKIWDREEQDARERQKEEKRKRRRIDLPIREVAEASGWIGFVITIAIFLFVLMAILFVFMTVILTSPIWLGAMAVSVITAFLYSRKLLAGLPPNLLDEAIVISVQKRRRRRFGVDPNFLETWTSWRPHLWIVAGAGFGYATVVGGTLILVNADPTARAMLGAGLVAGCYLCWKYGKRVLAWQISDAVLIARRLRPKERVTRSQVAFGFSCTVMLILIGLIITGLAGGFSNDSNTRPRSYVAKPPASNPMHRSASPIQRATIAPTAFAPQPIIKPAPEATPVLGTNFAASSPAATVLPVPSDFQENASLKHEEVPQSTFPGGERYSETRTRLLTIDETRAWPTDKVQYAINEIFARHGAVFPDKNVQRHFEQFAWYAPQQGVTFDELEASMPMVERQNVQTLGAARDVKLSSQPVAAGPWCGILFFTDGTVSKQELVFNPAATEVADRSSNAQSISPWGNYPVRRKGKNFNWAVVAQNPHRVIYKTLEPDATGQFAAAVCEVVQNGKIKYRATGTFGRNDVQLSPQAAPTPDPVAEQIMGGLLQGLSGALQEAARRRRP
jgi:MFS family permease